MTWDDLIQGYWLARRRDLSPTTQDGYQRVFRAFGVFVGSRSVESLTPADIDVFLNLQADSGISRRTQSDRWVVLSSLWTWAEVALGLPHLLRGQVTRPDYKSPAIIPFTEAEIKALLRAAEWSAPWEGKTGKPTRSRRPTYKRDRAILLVLLDTGLRVSEFCALTVGDYSPDNSRLFVRHGKGDKERYVYLGATAQQSLWAFRVGKDAAQDTPLFSTRTGTHMTRYNVGKMLRRIAINAKVDDVHPHRFRHTFAISFLRNGGNIYELQMALGHEGLETVKKYLHLAQSDLAAAQRKASPADRWNL